MEATEEEVDVEETETEDQMEQKDNNPWAEGIEAGPRASEELFFKKSKSSFAVLCEKFVFGTEQLVS